MPETKTYRIVYEETITHVFYVEGTSQEEAVKNFTEAGYAGELDFSAGEVSNGEITYIEEYNADDALNRCRRKWEDSCATTS